MQLPDFFGTRRLEARMRALEALLEVRSNELLRSSERAVFAAHTADKAAKVAEASVAELSKRLADKTVPSREPEPPSSNKPQSIFKPILLSLGCLWFLVAAAGIVTFVPAAFREPAEADVFPTGTSVLALPDSTLQQLQRESRKPTPLAAVMVWFDLDTNAAEYDLFVPWNLRGQEVTILLAGSAVLTNITSDQPGWVKTSTFPCADSDWYGVHKGDQCQIVRVALPKDVPAGGHSVCFGGGGSWDSVIGHIEVKLRGTASATSDVDWAHKAVALPIGFKDPMDKMPSFGGQSLGGSYSSLDAYTCQTLDFDSERWKIGAVEPKPFSAFPGGINWSNEDDLVTLVATLRDAEGRGNILMAVVGAIAALSIGFMPVAYEVWGAWYEGRRTRISRLRRRQSH